MCLSCRHYNPGTPIEVGGRPTCTAFPEGIPDAIFWDGRIDHRKPWPGDKGIRYDVDPHAANPFDFTTFVEVRGAGPVRPR